MTDEVAGVPLLILGAENTFERKHREHLQTVDRLKEKGFTYRFMREWTFERDNGRIPQMNYAHYYVEHFEDMKGENVGYLL